MKTIVIIPVIITTLCAANVYADCGSSKTLFSCTSTKGKQVEVCDSEKTIDYSFGKAKKKPDIAIKVPRDQVSTFQWEGVGSTESYAVDIPNDNAVYNVFWGVDRLTDKHPVEAGINVFVDKKLVTTINCADKDIVNNLQGVKLKATE